MKFNDRASIICFLDNQANAFEASGQRDFATILRAKASDIAASLDIEQGMRGIATPVDAFISELCAHSAKLGATSRREVLGETMSRAAVTVRHLAMWVARRRLGWNDERIGEAFNRDRTSVAHAIARAEEMREGDESIRIVTDEMADHGLQCWHCQAPIGDAA